MAGLRDRRNEMALKILEESEDTYAVCDGSKALLWCKTLSMAKEWARLVDDGESLEDATDMVFGVS